MVTFYLASFNDSLGRKCSVASRSRLGAKIHGGKLRARTLRNGWGPLTETVISGPFRQIHPVGTRG